MALTLRLHRDVKKHLEKLERTTQAKIRKALEDLRSRPYPSNADEQYFETVFQDTRPEITVIYQIKERELRVHKILAH